KNFCAVFRRDIRRAVGNILIEDHDNFARPARDAFQSAANPGGFRARNDVDGNGQFVHWFELALSVKQEKSSGWRFETAPSLKASADTNAGGIFRNGG